ncbi:Glu-tRNA(Gln) amidotransferase GatDE subunit D [archaeon]|nr:Glu-tRNA(Gln) amidotransferase GatDE subunit D [archaeon]
MPKPGDQIQVKTKDEIFDGILIPSVNKKTLILKLSSGYNIGISKSKIKSIKKLKTPKKIIPKTKIKQNTKLPSVSLIATGGTISSKIDYNTGAVKSLMEPEEILSLAPEISDIVHINKIESPFMVLSENMSYQHWKKIAETTAKLINKDEAVIITHGTDTLHFTSAALSFMLKNLSKPIILTYSQRSTDRGSTDTNLNLICSSHLAKSNMAEVMIVGHGESSDTYCLANRGTKVRKCHTSLRSTFRPINELPLAKVFPNGSIKILNKKYKKRTEEKVTANTKFEEKVALLKYYPGASPDILDYFIEKKYKGIVIETTGLGHVAVKESKYNWLPTIKKAINAGLTICAAPQTLYGKLNPLVYSTGREISKLGVIYLEDILPETAYIKLGHVLGNTKDSKEIKNQMLTNLSNEFNDRLTEDSFLY